MFPGQVLMMQRMARKFLNDCIQIALPADNPIDQGHDQLPVARIVHGSLGQHTFQYLIQRHRRFLPDKERIHGYGAGI